MNATLDTNIKNIEDAKASIKSAIEAKGVAVPQDALIDTYADRVNEIQNGGVSIDLTGTGWSSEPVFPISVSRALTVDEDLDYTRTKYAEWDPNTGTTLSWKYGNDKSLIYAPKIDTHNVLDMDHCYSGCNNMEAIPLIETGKVKKMDGCFLSCFSLASIPQLDLHSATSMKTCFSRCSKLTFIPGLNTGKVTDMSECFKECSALTSVPALDYSSVLRMDYCFNNCTSLTDISAMDIKKVGNMKSCFEGCTSLATITQLNTSSVWNMSFCFAQCENLTSLPLLDMSNVQEIDSCFWGCTNLKNIQGFKGLNRSFNLSSCKKLTKQSLLNVFNTIVEPYRLSGLITISKESNSLLNPQDTAIATKKGWVIEIR